jgi:lysophospholipid hydrolase
MSESSYQSSIEELMAFLTTTDLFSRFDEAILHKIRAALEVIQVASNEMIVRQGDTDDDLYLVVRGGLQVVAGYETGAPQILNELGPGESVGELAFLSGRKRTATVVAAAESTLLRLTKTHLDALAQEHPEAVQTVYRALQEQSRRRRLRTALQSTRIFGTLDPALMRELETELAWVTLRGGETLIRQGEPGDCLYVVISGRLRIVLEQEGQEVRTVREVGRGESIGEMALISGEQRSATVYAIRDSEVAQLSQTGFNRLLAQYPHAITNTFTRSILESLTRQLAGEKPGLDAVTTVALLPIHKEVPLAEFAHRFVEALTAIGPTLHLSNVRVDSLLGKTGMAQVDSVTGQATDAQLVAWLSEQETKYRHIVYEADPAPTAWSQRCLRQADHILLIGQASADPTPDELETALLGSEGGRSRKRKSLVLLHRTGARMPRGTQRWLALRQVDQHYHVRWCHEADFGRLARCVTGRAIGLALGGGAARGYAHIGVIRALEEAGIPIDMVGGTSMGSVIGAHYAMGWDAQTILTIGQTRAQLNQFDYTIPFVSLAAGRRMGELFQEIFGDTDIRDLWLPYFCVSTNLTKADVVLHTTGPVWRSIRASSGVPGLLPPLIHNGDALVDGGLLDNLPMDIMRAWCGSGTVIAVDVIPLVDLTQITPYGDNLAGTQVLQHKLQHTLNPLAPEPNIPSLVALLLRTVVAGSIYAQKTWLQQGLADLCLRPPVEKFDLLDFRAIDEIAEIGYRHAQAGIARWQVNGGTG